MRLPVRSACWYLTETIGVEWRNSDYNANLLVRAAKRKDLKNRYCDTPVGKLNRNHPERAEQTFAIWASEELDKWFPERPTLLIPIPSSTTTDAANQDFTAKRLCMAVGALLPRVKVDSGLEFIQSMAESHTTRGYRDPLMLYNNMRVNLGIRYSMAVERGHPILLVDDVFTSGSHITASVWRIACITGALTLGRATQIAPPNPFIVEPYDHEIPPGPDDDLMSDDEDSWF